MTDKIPNVLVVDDAREIRETLVRYLQKNGLRAAGAEGPVAARKLLRTNVFDIVILDILMPGEDGLSFCRYLCDALDLPVRDGLQAITLASASDVSARLALSGTVNQVRLRRLQARPT